jgi:ABC-type amino acid transport substrate-binding protein
MKSMNVFRGIVLATAAVVVFGGLPASAAEKLTVASEASYPPFSKTESDGSITGFEIELGNAVCERAGLECEWVKQDFDGMIAALLAKKFDFVFSSMSIKPERRKVALFSTPYYNENYRFYGAKGSGVTLPDGLKDKRIGVYAGATEEQFIKAKFGDLAETRGYENIDLIHADLEAGRIDFAFNGVLPGNEFLESDAGQAYEWFGPTYNDPILGEGVGAMFRKGDEALRDKIDAAILAVYEDGTFDEISNKYFPQELSVRADGLW